MAKKAVLIGCNYPGTKAELKGCVNDVKGMHKSLVERFGFAEGDVKVLVDTDPASTQPTGENIRSALTSLIGSASPGDSLFVHYSGHGTRVPAETGLKDDTGYDECIVPSDMNLITDDEFRSLVEKVPQDCRMTIVSDSCHSGGLIENTKVQIGEGAKCGGDGGEGGEAGTPAILSLIQNKSKKNALPKMLMHSRGHHHPGAGGRGEEGEEEGEGEDETEHPGVRNRTLPIPTLLDILKIKTCKEDIRVGNIRPTLFDMFGENSTPKIKKFMNFMLQTLGHIPGPHGEGSCVGGGLLGSGEGGGLLGVAHHGLVGGHVAEFLKNKLGEKDEDYLKPAIEAICHRKEEVFAGPTPTIPIEAIFHGKEGVVPGPPMPEKPPHQAVLISGCQSHQTSADATPPGKPDEAAFGALSNAIQVVLTENTGEIDNRKLVNGVRNMLSQQGFKQRPGLFCSDQVAGSPFIF